MDTANEQQIGNAYNVLSEQKKSKEMPILMVVPPLTFDKWVLEGRKNNLKIFEMKNIGFLFKYCNKAFKFKKNGKNHIGKKEFAFNKKHKITDTNISISLAQIRMEKENLKTIKSKNEYIYEQKKGKCDGIFVESDLEILYKEGFTADEINPETLFIEMGFDPYKLKKVIYEHDIVILNSSLGKKNVSIATDILNNSNQYKILPRL